MNCEALKEFASSMNKKGHMVKKEPAMAIVNARSETCAFRLSDCLIIQQT